MGRYRARDLLLLPNLISFTRLPLAWVFVWVTPEPLYRVVVLLMAAATDVVDGFLARRFGLATPVGAVVDGFSDKFFAAVVVLTLIFEQRLSIFQAGLLGIREFAELPLVLWWSVRSERRRARAAEPKANYMGKAATVFQFIAIVALLWRSPLFDLALAVAASTGALAAMLYWRRELKS